MYLSCFLQPLNVAIALTLAAERPVKVSGCYRFILDLIHERTTLIEIPISQISQMAGIVSRKQRETFPFLSVTWSCPTIVTPVAASELCRARTHVRGGFTCEHRGYQLSRWRCKYCVVVVFFLFLLSHIHNPLKLLHNSCNGSLQGRHR